MKIAIIVGHSKKRYGCKNDRHPMLKEFDINADMGKDIVNQLKEAGHNAKLIIKPTLKSKIKAANSFHPDIQVSLHLNAFKGYESNSHGCEVLINKGDEKSLPFAKIMLEWLAHMVDTNRGIVERPHKGPTSLYVLLNTNATVKILCEPLFLDGEEGELLLDRDNRDNLALMYVEGILEYIDSIT